jgi:hypothetical protein
MYRSHAGDIGPVSLVACPRRKLSLSLLLYWLVWERNWIQTHGLVSRRAENCAGSPFSQEQWDLSKSVGACGVLVWFSPVGCTSIQITMTLGYEYRLFVAIIT